MGQTTVLIVDDEALIRWSLSERLKAEGHLVLEAGMGIDALKKLPDGVDVVLLDLKLPDTDGMSLLRKIKQYDADIPVIVLSAYAPSEAVDEAMQIGAYRVLEKPFDLDGLTAVVDRALRRVPWQLQERVKRPPVRPVSQLRSTLRRLRARRCAAPT